MDGIGWSKTNSVTKHSYNYTSLYNENVEQQSPWWEVKSCKMLKSVTENIQQNVELKGDKVRCIKPNLFRDYEILTIEIRILRGIYLFYIQCKIIKGKIIDIHSDIVQNEVTVNGITSIKRYTGFKREFNT